MRVDQHRTGGGGHTSAATRDSTVPGRTDVKDRVYRKVTEHTSAALIGVAHGDVQVDVSQHRSGIAIRIATPLPIPNLADTAAIAAGPPVLERARRLQEDLPRHLAEILGRDITRITLTITGATTPKRRRVT